MDNKNINWLEISRTPGLSENFMEEHADKLNWAALSEYQLLSDDFIKRHANQIDWPILLESQEVPNQLVYECESSIDWHEVASNWHDFGQCPYPQEFVDEFGEKIQGYLAEIEASYDAHDMPAYDEEEYEEYDEFER